MKIIVKSPVWRLVVALAVVATALVSSTPSATAAVTRAFDVRFTQNTAGAIVLTGNTSLACPSSAAGCTAAKNASSSTASANNSLDNNGYLMANVDVDTDPTTFNSSRNTLTIPQDAQVLFAGLYWGADTSAGNGGAVAPSAANNGRVLFAGPGSTGYTQLTASRLDTAPATNGGVLYQGFVDVTAQVAQRRSGQYSVANIQAGTGANRYAGWSLVVAYADPNEPVRNLTIFDGFAVVQQSPAADANVTIPVSGFRTPLAGPVRTRVGVVAYEGDVGIVGDSLRLNSTTVANPLNPSANNLNSSMTSLGASVLTGVPSQTNLMGVDVDTFQLDGVLANGATSATITLNSTGDTYYPGVVTFSTELYAPHLTLSKNAVDLNGGDLEPSDVIRYTITAASDGADGATQVVVSDVIAAGTTYVPGSLRIDSASVTDTAGDDTGEYEASAARVRARLGTGATATSGGNVPIGSQRTVVFDVVVDSTVGAAPVLNTADVTTAGSTSGIRVTGRSNTTATTTSLQSDLTALVAFDREIAQLGETVTIATTITNRGPSTESSPRATIALPSGFTVSSLPPSCSAAGATVTCTVPALALGDRATVSIVGSFASGTGPAQVRATVSGTNNDRFPNNDTSTAVVERNAAPTAGDVSASTSTDLATTIDVAGAISDPDGDPLVVSVDTSGASGSAVMSGGGRITYTPAVGFKGTDTFTYTVSDGRGGTSSATITVTVANGAPVANPDRAGTAGNTPVTIDVTANDTDPNGDPIAVSAVTQPANGSVSVVGGAVRYVPNAGFEGTDTFTVTITDGTATATSTVTVVVAGQDPVAIDDRVSTPNATPIVIDVLDNDSDPNGDALTVVAVTTPSNGSVARSGDIVTYTPDASFVGTATFTYTIADPSGRRSTATVFVSVENAAPVARPDSLTVPSGQSATVDVLANDSDANGDGLSVVGLSTSSGAQVSVSGGVVAYRPPTGFKGTDVVTYTVSDGRGGFATSTVDVVVENGAPVASNVAASTETDSDLTLDVSPYVGDPNDDALTITSTSTPTSGTVTFVGTTLVYTPTHGFRGTDSFTYTVSDGTDVATATVTVRVANAAPVAVDDVVTTATDTPVDVDVTSNDTDANGDATTVVSTTPAASGTVTVRGNVITYTPDPGFKGDDRFEYTITDGTATSSASVLITVDNAAPIAVDDDVAAIDPSTAVLAVTDNDSDPNGDPITIVSVSNVRGSNVRVASPTTVEFTPIAGFRGVATFTYTISDGTSTSTATVRVTVNDTAPVARDDTATTGTDTPVAIVVMGNDDDVNDDPLTVASASSSTPGARLTVGPDGVVTYVPPTGFRGDDTFTYTVSDGTLTASATVTVTVRNAAPVARADSGVTRTDRAVTIDVLANDSDANGDGLSVVSVSTPSDGGTTSVDAFGTILYTPAPGFVGVATFTYTVGDGTATTTATVSVKVVNSAPAAADDSAVVATNGSVDVAVLDNDIDGDDDPLSVVDQTPATNGSVTRAGNVLTYTPAPGFRGDDSFTYTISDGVTTDTATVFVTVENAAPTAAPISLSTPGATAVTVSVASFVADANPADVLSVVGVTQPTNGSVSVDGLDVTYTPDPSFTGRDTFEYTVTDGDDVATATITIDVADAAPVAVDDEASTDTATPVDVDVVANDSDANGDVLAVTSVDGVDPAAGSAVVGLDARTITFTPTSTFKGVTTFTYTVDDGERSASAIVTVTVANAAPLADDDEVTVDGATETVIDVVVDDRDPNGDLLTVVAVTQPVGGRVVLDGGVVTFTATNGFRGVTTFTYTVADDDGATSTATVTVTVTNIAPVAAPDVVETPTNTPVDVFVLGNDTDPNGDGLTVTASTRPVHGGVVISAQGTITYTPDPGYRGDDTFEYTITDGTDSVTGTVFVTVRNAPPVANDDSARTRTDTAIDIAVLDDDTDLNGDTISLVSVTQPATGGSVSIVGDRVRFTPTPGFVGDTTFTYTITDGDETAVATVTVTVVDGRFVAVDDDVATDGETPVDVGVLDNDLNPDGDPVVVTLGTPSPDGTATVDGSVIRFVPGDGFKGVTTFTYTLTDGGLSSTATVRVTVRNIAPTTTDDSASTLDGEPVDVDVLGNDSDRNGDPLTITDVGPVPIGVATVRDGVVTYTPPAGFVGVVTFPYTVSDGESQVDGTITVTVIDPFDTDPPVVDPDPGVGPTTPPTTPDTTGAGGGTPGSTPVVVTPGGATPTGGAAPGTGTPGPSTTPTARPTSDGRTASPTARPTTADDVPLPRTGAEVVVVLAAATALLGAGSVLLGASRRRRTTP